MPAWELLWEQKEIFLDCSCITYSPTQKLPFPQITFNKDWKRSVFSPHHPFWFWAGSEPMLDLHGNPFRIWQLVKDRNMYLAAIQREYANFYNLKTMVTSLYSHNERSFVSFFCNFWKCGFHNINSAIQIYCARNRKDALVMLYALCRGHKQAHVSA